MRDAVARELEQTLAPVIRAEGGEVVLVDVTPSGIVRLRVGKSWAATPATPLAIRYVVEELLKRAVPGVTGIETTMDFPSPTRL